MAYEGFRDRLIRERTAREWTQDDLATRAGLKRQTITAWEGARPIGYPISPTQLDGLVRAFGDSPVEWLLSMGFRLECPEIGNEQEASLLRLFRAVPPRYRRAVLRGLQEVAGELDAEPL